MSEKSKTALIFSGKYLEHKPSATHPESPNRLRWIVSHLQEIGLLKQLLVQEPKPADIKWISTIHSPEYIKRVHDSCASGYLIIDCPDVEVSSKSYDTGLQALNNKVTIVNIKIYFNFIN